MGSTVLGRGQVLCALVLGSLGGLVVWFVPDIVASLKVPDPLVSIGPVTVYAAWAGSFAVGLLLGVMGLATQGRLSPSVHGATSPSIGGGGFSSGGLSGATVLLLAVAALAVGVVSAQIVVEGTVSAEVLARVGLTVTGVILPLLGVRDSGAAKGGQSWRSRGSRLTNGLRY